MTEPTAYQSSLTEEGRYRLLVEGISDYAIYLVDPAGVVTSWNTGAQRMKGYSAVEVVGSHFSRFYTEEDQRAGRPERNLRLAIEKGVFEEEGWRVRRDGTKFWAHVVIDPIYDREGRHVAFAKVTRDLTERKKAEADLLRSEQQFRLLVQGVTDYAIYMLDPEGRISSWNAGAARIKGYQEDEIVGEHFSRFYTPEDRENGEPGKALDAARTSGRFEKEAWRVRRNGSRFWAHVIIDAIRDTSGVVIGFAKVTRDITERKQAQEDLERAREALLQSQKMEAVGQLTGGVAHDFNNLLMAIMGSLELVRKRLPYDTKITPFLENAYQAAQRGGSLTKRMLAFARRQELKLQPVEVPALVRGMVDMLQRSLGPTVSIETSFPPLAPAHTDPHQLESSLLNLALNARDAMPAGGTITITAREETVTTERHTDLKPGRYICLAIIDGGEGMDKNTLARAMEPFFTTKAVGRGTGLGLPMVHGLAVQSGGKLVLQSERGKGTTVELWLPVATSISSLAGDDAATGGAEGRPQVVLAIDDDPLVLINTVAMLQDLGHEVLEASSASEAIEILRGDTTIDVVITDHAMPWMTGKELVEVIQRDWPDIHTIIASGYADLTETDTSASILSKPFTLRQLANALLQDRVLDKGQTMQLGHDL